MSPFEAGKGHWLLSVARGARRGTFPFRNIPTIRLIPKLLNYFIDTVCECTVDNLVTEAAQRKIEL